MRKETFDLFAVVAPGLEEVCADELTRLEMEQVRVVPGGVEFVGGLRDLYRANLWLRSASRVLVRLGEIRCRDFPTLFRRARQLPWGRFVRPTTRLTVRAGSRASRLGHTGRIASTVAAACDRALGRQQAPDDGVRQLVLARIENDTCRFSVDSSGDLLHRRGYRRRGGHAPLRETLAAGILQSLEWDGSRPLVDPMCGSGTFLVEGALLACRRPPGEKRGFAFMDWPRYRPGLWQALLQEAAQVERTPHVAVSGYDRAPEAIEAAGEAVDRAGVAGVTLQLGDLSALPSFPGQGLVICNPPYGARLEPGRNLAPLFRNLGDVCRRNFAGWQWAFLCPDDALARASRLPVERVATIDNGGIRVGLFATRRQE